MSTNDTDFSFDLRCADAIDLVTDHLDDALSPADLARFESHLASCEGCTLYVDQMKMTITLASEVSNQQVEIMPANFDELLALFRAKGNTNDS